MEIIYAISVNLMIIEGPGKAVRLGAWAHALFWEGVVFYFFCGRAGT